MQEEPLNSRRFQFRTVDLFLVTVVVALTVVAATEDPIRGTAHSPNLLVLFAGILGAVTGRIVSDAFRLGFVGGLLFGVLGYLLAVFAFSLGVKIAAHSLFFVCVSAGGIIGGLLPTMLHRWRRASLRIHMSTLFVAVALMVILTLRWWTVSEQNRAVVELRAAGAYVQYHDVNPSPAMFDSRRMELHFEWLRKLLRLRVITDVSLREQVDHRYACQLLVDKLPFVQDLRLHAKHMDVGTFELLNSGKFPQLDHLRFYGRGFGDASLSRLDPLPNIVVLDLKRTSVTDESIEHIATFPRLVALDVSETDVTADGVKRLKSKIGRVYSDN